MMLLLQIVAAGGLMEDRCLLLRIKFVTLLCPLSLSFYVVQGHLLSILKSGCGWAAMSPVVII